MSDDTWDPTMDNLPEIEDDLLETEHESEHDPMKNLSHPEIDSSLPESTQNYYGTPMEDMAHWQPQTTTFTCAPQAVRGILEACTGEFFSEAEVAAEMAEQGWLHTTFSEQGAGTQMMDVGKLLELHGIPTHQVEHASMGDLVSELAAGHKVIVGVNSNDLWNPSPLNSLFEQGADHAIWVTGVDKSDPSNIKVIINDSGDPDGAGKSYPLDQFRDAWEDSNQFYVATDHAPPDLHITSPAFDQDKGFFMDIVDWASEHTVPIAVMTVGGLSAADLMGKQRLRESSQSLREKVLNRRKRKSGGS